MKDREGQALEFGPDSRPPTAFALLVAEAFDRGMSPAEWATWSAPPADPALSAALRSIWASEVWPRLVAQYGIVAQLAAPETTHPAEAGCRSRSRGAQARRRRPKASPANATEASASAEGSGTF